MSLNIVVKNARAVHSADIDLMGITVLSGINGCGKSTISRSVYEILSAALNYNDFVDAYIISQYSQIGATFFSAIGNLSGLISRQDFQKLNSSFLLFAIKEWQNTSIEFVRGELDSSVNSLQNYVVSLKNLVVHEKMNRYQAFLSVIASIVEKTADDDLSEIFEAIHQKIEEISNSAIEFKSRRSLEILYSSTRRNEWLNPRKFNLQENGVPVIDSETNRVLFLNSIKKVFYIDTPMAFGEQSSNKEYWNALNTALKKGNFSKSMLEYPQDETLGILNGSFDWESKRKNTLVYTLKNGVSFDLLKYGATGLKSFTMLQTLFREELIDETTLLILDEPEAHLHPQWIVHFARFLVLLRKETGCNFLISSHSTDMVASLHDIATKELRNTPTFYLGQENKEDHLVYDFINCGSDIEPIFNTFNISFELTNRFSSELNFIGNKD